MLRTYDKFFCPYPLRNLCKRSSLTNWLFREQKTFSNSYLPCQCHNFPCSQIAWPVRPGLVAEPVVRPHKIRHCDWHSSFRSSDFSMFHSALAFGQPWKENRKHNMSKEFIRQRLIVFLDQDLENWVLHCRRAFWKDIMERVWQKGFQVSFQPRYSVVL